MPQSGAALADWLARLESFSPHEIDLGLQRVQLVLDKLALEPAGTILHVAGTNGKGSSVALLQALLMKSGAVVGAYTSPHIVRYNERITVHGDAVGDDDIVAAFERIESIREGVPLTYFEYGTLAALVVFAQYKVEIAILEVGMGGRLDAVNAVEPMAGLITNVSLDHCDWLGEDIESIAAEKAGIMRSAKPIVYASARVPDAIHRHAAETGAELILAGRDYTWDVSASMWRWSGRHHELEGLVRPALQGPIQIVNAAGVLALVEAAGFDGLLDTATINDAFADVRLPGRMQTVRSDRTWLFDVAHNPAAAETLAESLRQTGSDGQTIAIVGMLDDKQVDGIVGSLAGVVDKWIAVGASSKRAYSAAELARRIANVSNCACLEAGSIDDAIKEARRMSGDSDRILVTGSFYVVGPALEALGLYSPR